MKKKLFLSTMILSTSLLQVCAQVNWGQVPLTGPTSKIITAAAPRFSVSFTAIFPAGELPPQNIDYQTLQTAAFAPGTAEQLFEKLGGPFSLYDPFSQKQQTIEMKGQTNAMPGSQLGICVGKRFEINAGVQQFWAAWSGAFPVIVFSPNSHDQMQPKTLQGNIQASASGLQAQAGGSFFVTTGRFRPYLSGGINGQFPLQTTSEASIAGVPLPLEIEPVAVSYSLFGGAGVRWSFWENAFLDAGCSYRQLPGGTYNPAVTAGIGWRF